MVYALLQQLCHYYESQYAMRELIGKRENTIVPDYHVLLDCATPTTDCARISYCPTHRSYILCTTYAQTNVASLDTGLFGFKSLEVRIAH
jgi:hypothetical protein